MGPQLTRSSGAVLLVLGGGWQQEVFFHLAFCDFSPMAAARRSPVFHEPSPDDGRQRDIFPLPLIEGAMEAVEKKGVCRAVKQRILRRAAVHRRVNRCISALNSLYFGGEKEDVKVPSGGLSSLPLVQRDAINLITRRVVEAGTPPRDACGPEALRGASGSQQCVS